MSVLRKIHGAFGISIVTVFAIAVGCASSDDTGTPREDASPGEARSAMLFMAPTVGGTYVDYCLHFARDCGKPAADAFCQRSGYTSAVDFDLAPNLGHTVILGDPGSECRHPGCGGFRFIDCQ